MTFIKKKIIQTIYAFIINYFLIINEQLLENIKFRFIKSFILNI